MKSLIILITLIAMVLISGCVNYNYILNNVCQEKGHIKLTDYRFKICEGCGTTTLVDIECDNEYIYEYINCYDDNNCIGENKWGDCNKYNKTIICR